MFKSNTMRAAAILMSVAAAPALALDMTADVMLGAAPEDMTIMKMVEGSAFVGNEVRTKDQVVIGLVDAVYEDGEKGPMVLIAIKSDIAAQSSVKTFTLPLADDMVSDGSLTLAWTEAELFVALSDQLKPAGSN
jgi:hypothetical protein